jgi:hypothetical protein
MPIKTIPDLILTTPDRSTRTCSAPDDSEGGVFSSDFERAVKDKPTTCPVQPWLERRPPSAIDQYNRWIGAMWRRRQIARRWGGLQATVHRVALATSRGRRDRRRCDGAGGLSVPKLIDDAVETSVAKRRCGSRSKRSSRPTRRTRRRRHSPQVLKPMRHWRKPLGFRLVLPAALPIRRAQPSIRRRR